MALIKCKECGKEISDKAKICPNCGCPNEMVKETTNPNAIFTINGQNENMDELWKTYKRKKNCIVHLEEKYDIDKKLATRIVEDYIIKSGAKEPLFSGCSIVFLISVALFLLISCSMFVSNKNTSSDETYKNSTQEATVDKKSEDLAQEQYTQNDNNIEFELGTVYDENGFVISLTSASTDAMTFEILNNTDKEYDVYLYPSAINNTMEEFDHAIVERVSAGKKTETTVDIIPEENVYDIIKSVSFAFAFYEITDSNVSFMEFESDPIVIKTNMYDDNDEYVPYNVQYDDGNIQVGKVIMTENEVQISIINNSNNYYQININNASINEWTYDVNNGLFVTIFNEPIFPHTQKILKINYEEFIKDKGISAESFEFSLDLTCPNDIEKSYQTEKIVFSK